MKVITSPNFILPFKNSINLFLGGSIEMGKASEWQKEFIESFKDKNITIFNPRRNDWDST